MSPCAFPQSKLKYSVFSLLLIVTCFSLVLASDPRVAMMDTCVAIIETRVAIIETCVKVILRTELRTLWEP